MHSKMQMTACILANRCSPDFHAQVEGTDADDEPSAADHGVGKHGMKSGGEATQARYAVPLAMGLLEQSTVQPTALRTADIVTRIIENRKRFEARNAKRERKELDYVLHKKQYIEEP